jgi:hypothetical protein
MMTETQLEEIEKRAAAAADGPWYWRDGTHTEDAKTSDAGGLHTMHPFPMRLPDGRLIQQDAVIFPYVEVTGDPYWIERFKKARAGGKTTLGSAMETYGRKEDKDFIAHSREDVVALLGEVRRLQRLLVDAHSGD